MQDKDTETPSFTLVWLNGSLQKWRQTKEQSTDIPHVVALIDGEDPPGTPQRWRAVIELPVGVRANGFGVSKWLNRERQREGSTIAVYYLRPVRRRWSLTANRGVKVLQMWELDNRDVNGLPIAASSVVTLLPAKVQCGGRCFAFKNADVRSAIQISEKNLVGVCLSTENATVADESNSKTPVTPETSSKKKEGNVQHSVKLLRKKETKKAGLKRPRDTTTATNDDSNSGLYKAQKKLLDDNKNYLNKFVVANMPRGGNAKEPCLFLESYTYGTTKALRERRDAAGKVVVHVPNNDAAAFAKMQKSPSPAGVVVSNESVRALLNRLPRDVKYQLAFLDYCRTFKAEANFNPGNMNSHNPSLDLRCLFAGHLAPHWCVAVNNSLRGDPDTTVGTVLKVLSAEARKARMKILHFFVKCYGNMRCVGAVGTVKNDET